MKRNVFGTLIDTDATELSCAQAQINRAAATGKLAKVYDTMRFSKPGAWNGSAVTSNHRTDTMNNTTSTIALVQFELLTLAELNETNIEATVRALVAERPAQPREALLAAALPRLVLAAPTVRWADATVLVRPAAPATAECLWHVSAAVPIDDPSGLADFLTAMNAAELELEIEPAGDTLLITASLATSTEAEVWQTFAGLLDRVGRDMAAIAAIIERYNNSLASRVDCWLEVVELSRKRPVDALVHERPAWPHVFNTSA